MEPFRTIPATTGRLAVLVFALLAAGAAAAPAALAVDDLARPDATVLRGTSCHPGGVVIEVHPDDRWETRGRFSIRVADAVVWLDRDEMERVGSAVRKALLFTEDSE